MIAIIALGVVGGLILFAMLRKLAPVILIVVLVIVGQWIANTKSDTGQTAAEQSAGGTTVSSPLSSQPSSAFQQGQADRQSWEAWFSSQSSDYRAGADYWADGKGGQ